MNKILIFIVLILLIAILAVGGYLMWGKWRQPNINQQAIENATKGTVPEIDVTNPMGNKPDINPVDAANPIKNVKTNPFE